MSELKESREEKENRLRLDANYDDTGYCPFCRIKLAIDDSCGSPICTKED